MGELGTRSSTRNRTRTVGPVKLLLVAGGITVATVGAAVNNASAQQPEPTNSLVISGSAECHPDRDGRWIASFTADADSTDPTNTWTLPSGWADPGTPIPISVDRTREINVAENFASYGLSATATFASGPTATGFLTLDRPAGCDQPIEPTNTLVLSRTAECHPDRDGRWIARSTADADSTDPTNTWTLPPNWSDANTPIPISVDRTIEIPVAATTGSIAVVPTATFANGPTAINFLTILRPDGCVLVNSGQIEATAACATTDGQVRLTVALTAGSVQSNEYTVTATNQAWSPAADTMVQTSTPRSASIEVPDDADHTVTATVEWLVGVDTVVDALVYSADELDCSAPAQPSVEPTAAAPIDAAPTAAAPTAAPATAAAAAAPVEQAGSLPETGRATNVLLLAAVIVSLSGLMAVRVSRRPAG